MRKEIYLMRAVVTRVKSASVTIDGHINGEIGQGFLVLLGVGPNDTHDTAVKLAEKICNLRVFEDESGKMNRSLDQVGGSLLVVSQFTLPAVPVSPVPPSLIWPSLSMRTSWLTAGRAASRWNTANSAPICRWHP